MGNKPGASTDADGPLGINVGANKDSEDRTADYVIATKRLANLADYVTVNISSPNTPGLRALQDKAALEVLLGAPVRHFCYPYGEYTPEHVAMARQAGFQTVTTTRRGRSAVQGDLLELPRVPVVRSTSGNNPRSM